MQYNEQKQIGVQKWAVEYYFDLYKSAECYALCVNPFQLSTEGKNMLYRPLILECARMLPFKCQ